MYQPDEHDAVVALSSLPQSDVGAPLPAVFATEQSLALVYVAAAPELDANSAFESNELVAAVIFERPRCHIFGPPNDEAFSGHPLAARGLHPYAAFEVHRSSWLRSLERMNSVHPRHRPAAFASLRHFIFAFHDSTFECIADGFAVNLQRGSVASVLKSLLRESSQGAA